MVKGDDPNRGFSTPCIHCISVSVISLSLWLQLITPTTTLIILDITKTSSMRNFVWSAKKYVNAKSFLVRMIFCTHLNFCKHNETSKILLTSFGGCKNIVRRENPFILDIHPSLDHQISQHMDYEANVTVWLPAILIELHGPPKSLTGES